MDAVPVLLSAQALADVGRQLPQWQLSSERGGVLQRNFVFADFAQAFGFMAQVAVVAERHNHHPEWRNVYHRVEVTLTTHDAQGITAQDVQLALLMDRIAAGMAAAASAP